MNNPRAKQFDGVCFSPNCDDIMADFRKLLGSMGRQLPHIRLRLFLDELELLHAAAERARTYRLQAAKVSRQS